MPNYASPKSSVPKKGPKSSLHPNGAPGFTETLAGLKGGLANLGSHLVGAAAGMVGNLISPLTNLRKSAEEGDEESERAYQDALAMLRGSGSEIADTLLKELGEQPEEEAEGNEESLREVRESENAEDDLELTLGQTQASADRPAEAQPALTPENSTPQGKVTCLECGAEFRLLTNTHLSKHGMSLTEYREKHSGTITTVPAGSSTKDASGKFKKKRVA